MGGIGSIKRKRREFSGSEDLRNSLPSAKEKTGQGADWGKESMYSPMFQNHLPKVRLKERIGLTGQEGAAKLWSPATS